MSSASAKGRVRERRNRDEEVLAAAIDVMSERGYAATSIQEVADRVGVLKGSLYHYFSSKEELLARILELSNVASLQIRAEAESHGATPFTELTTWIRLSARWYMDNVELANIYFAEWRFLTGDRLALTEARAREYVRHIRNLVDKSKESGELTTSIDSRILTKYIIESLNGVRSWPGTGSFQKIPKQEIEDSFVALTVAALHAK